MAKVKINKKAIQFRIERSVVDAINNPQFLKEVGEFSVSRIRGFARNSKPLQGEDVGKFPALKDPPTPQIRKSLSRYNKTHPAFKAKRSNVTFTGQLLDAVNFVIEAAKGSIRIFVQDSGRVPYKRKDGSVIESQEKTNKAVYDSLLKRNPDYKFLGMDDKGIQRIKNIALKYLRKALRKK